MTTVDATRPVTGGVDTHLDVNVAAALDPIGGLLAVAEFPTTPTGHRRLAEFLASFGTLTRVGSKAPALMERGSPGTCEAPAWRWSKSTGRTASPAGARASRTRSMPSRRPGPRFRAEPKARARAATATSRRSGRSLSPSAHRVRQRSRRSIRSAISASQHQKGSRSRLKGISRGSTLAQRRPR